MNWVISVRAENASSRPNGWFERVSLWISVVVVVVQSLSCVWLLVTPWTVACQASLSFTVSWSLLKLMSIESVMPSSHLLLCCPLLLLPLIFPRIRVFSNKSGLSVRMQKPKTGVLWYLWTWVPRSITPNSEMYRKDPVKEKKNICKEKKRKASTPHLFQSYLGAVLYLYDGHYQYFLLGT